MRLRSIVFMVALGLLGTLHQLPARAAPILIPPLPSPSVFPGPFNPVTLSTRSLSFSSSISAGYSGIYSTSIPANAFAHANWIEARAHLGWFDVPSLALIEVIGMSDQELKMVEIQLAFLGEQSYDIGELDDETIRALANQSSLAEIEGEFLAAMSSDLHTGGFHGSTLEEQEAAFQRHYSTTWRLTDPLFHRRLANDLEVGAAAKAKLEHCFLGTPDSDDCADPRLHENATLVGSIESDGTYTLLMNERTARGKSRLDIREYTRTNGRLSDEPTARFKGSAARAHMHLRAQAEAAAKSNNTSIILYLGPTWASAKTIEMQLGPSIQTFARDEWNLVRHGGGQTPTLDTVMDTSVVAGAQHVLVWGAPFSRGRSLQDSKTKPEFELGGSHAYHDAIATAVALQARYSATVQWFVVNDLDRGLENLSKLSAVSVKDAIIYQGGSPDSGAFRTEIPNVKEFERHGLYASNDDDDFVDKSLVILQLDNKNPKTIAHALRTLGDAGLLRDKYVLLFSCEALVDPLLISDLLARFGAVGVQSFFSKIQPHATRRVVAALAQLLAAGPVPINLALNQAIDLALVEPDLPDDVIDDLLTLKQNLVQLSLADWEDDTTCLA